MCIKKVSPRPFMLMGLFVVLSFLLVACGGGEPEAEYNDIEAYVVLQQVAEDQLLSPSSAEWPAISEITCRDLGEGEFYFVGFFYSQNALGAMVRTGYTATVKYAGNEEYTVEDLVLDQ